MSTMAFVACYPSYSLYPSQFITKKISHSVVSTSFPQKSCISMSANSSSYSSAWDRRQFLRLAIASIGFPALLFTASPLQSTSNSSAYAVSGLKQFPLTQPLSNQYIFMRSGECVTDALGVARTNPVDKINVENGLTKKGVQQVAIAADALFEQGVNNGDGLDCWLYASTTCRSMQTADILAYRLMVPQNRIVPEFAFLDARGVGALEGQSWNVVNNALLKLDQKDPALRTTPGEDGTPNESVFDVVIRMRQLLSKLETQYNDCKIIVVSPDSYNLSILEALLKNVDLSCHQQFAYAPGEFRSIKPVIYDQNNTDQVFSSQI